MIKENCNIRTMSFLDGSQGSLHHMSKARWQQIQKDTFTNWVNEQLKSRGLGIADLRTDLCDGVLLATLVEVLQRRSLSGTVTAPSNQYEKLQNLTVALDAIASDNIRIINIGKVHIVNQVCHLYTEYY